MIPGIVLASLIGGGFLTGNTLLNKFLPGGDSGVGSMSTGSPSLGQTAMSQNPIPISSAFLYPKRQPSIQQNGSLLGNSLFNRWGRR